MGRDAQQPEEGPMPDFEQMDWTALKGEVLTQQHAGYQAGIILEALRRSVEAQNALQQATLAASDCAASQTATVIRLTDTLRVLTWVLVGFGAVQLLLMVWSV